MKVIHLILVVFVIEIVGNGAADAVFGRFALLGGGAVRAGPDLLAVFLMLFAAEHGVGS